MNNNRNNNTFIPNPQDLWAHPDIYSLNNQSNGNGGQVPPFTAHQQVQQLQQGQYPMYSVGYTTAAPNNLQASFNPMFSQAWEGLEGNNGSGMQMNYSYQQVNSCYPNQHQQILQQHMMPQIVSQSPRVVPLPLDAPHFVPFSMNLSPSGSMVPFSLSPPSSIHSAPVSINSGSFNSTPMVHFTTNSSPPKIHPPLNSRSSGTPAPAGYNMSLNSRSSTPLVPLSFTSQSSNPLVNMSLNSRSFANMVSSPINSQSSGSMTPLSFNTRSSTPTSQIPYTSTFAASTAPINFNSRSSTPMSHFIPNCVPPKTPVPLNSHSPASMTSFSNSSSPSPPPPPKKPTRSRKKKSPMRPLPVNPSQLPLPTVPADRSPPLPLYLNRSSGIITSNVSSWNPMLSHLPSPTVGVSGSRPSAVVPVPAHLSSPTVPSAVNRLFPLTPLPAHQSSHAIPVSAHRSPPRVPVAAHLCSPMIPLSVNRPSHAVPTSAHLFPMSPMSINRASASPIPPASFNPSPPRMPLPVNVSPTLMQPRNSSPPKVNLSMSRLSVLHYAPERAVTPTSSSHDELENVDVFQEEEILQLVGVGEITDQSADLHHINPLHELNMACSKVKSEVNDTSSICSWEQDAFKGAANSPPGDEDLETELKRFYCPPSPPKSSDAKRTSADLEPSSNSSNSGTTTISNTEGNLTVNRRKSATKLDKPESNSPKKSPRQTKHVKPGKAFIDLSSDEDDDLKVLLVKVGDKRRRGGSRQAAPPKIAQRITRGRGQGSKNSEITRVPSPGVNRSPGGVGRGAPGVSNKQMDQRLNAIARPAYPNGRYVAVAPRSTVPIPPRNQGSSNSKSVKSDPNCVIHPRSILIKGTARKSTAPLPTGILPSMMTARKSTTPLPKGPIKKAVARKSTAPMPKTVIRNTGVPQRSETAQPPMFPSNTPSYAIASTSRGQRNPRSRSVNTASRTINPVVKLKEDPQPRLVLKRLSSDDLSTYTNRPPIKMKLSLVGTKGKTGPHAARNNKDGQFRVKASLTDDINVPNSKGRLTRSRAENPGRPTRANLAIKHNKSQLQQREKQSSIPGEPVIGSDDELLIVQEYLADSDDSLDWEGERDEASSESETEPESGEETDDLHGSSNEANTVDKTPIDSENSTSFKPVLVGAVEMEMSNVTEEPSESDSDCEPILIPKIPVIPSFEAPRPKVILKGTKEDADKAVTNLRDVLAQLSNYKTLTSLFRR